MINCSLSLLLYGYRKDAERIIVSKEDKNKVISNVKVIIEDYHVKNNMSVATRIKIVLFIAGFYKKAAKFNRRYHDNDLVKEIA